MKIAFTADAHLTTQQEHPERFQAMEEILHRCGDLGVDMLVIAGDLFDRTSPNYAAFEALYQNHRPQQLETHIIPGNHDLGLTDSALALDDLIVYTKPRLVQVGQNQTLLFLPFRDQATMGEDIAPLADHLSPHRWSLIGHGDWSGGKKYPDPYEQGVYMPLTRADLKSYQPQHVFLGHIHLPHDDDRVHYPGSPCPLDITETGTRRILLYDTENGTVSSQLVDCPLLYFQADFLVFPMEDETAYLKSQIVEWVHSWDLPEGWEDKVQVRTRIKGYSRNRQAIRDAVREALAPYQFYDDEGPDLSKLNHGVDPGRARIARNVKAWVEDLSWPTGSRDPQKDQILEQALKVIYGG